MAGPYSIRPPESDQEWEAVKKLLRDYYDEFDDKTCFTSFDAEMSNIQKLYAEKDKFKLIAVDDESGEVVGCVAYRSLDPGVAEMKRLYVVPSRRGYKLGRILAEAIIEKAREAGYNSMILDTMMEMKAAQQLYHHLGFDVIPPYNHQDTSKIVCFEKKL